MPELNNIKPSLERFNNISPELGEILQKIDPYAGEYLGILISDIEESGYETGYKDNPENVLYCFNDGRLERDLNEVIDDLRNATINDENLANELESALLKFATDIKKDRPVLFLILKPIFDGFNITDIIQKQEDLIKEIQNNITENIPQRPRYRLPNVIWNYTRINRFLRNCGLTNTNGNGDHKKWYNTNGGYITVVDEGSEVHLENIIKELLGKGISIVIIQQACHKMGMKNFVIL